MTIEYRQYSIICGGIQRHCAGFEHRRAVAVMRGEIAAFGNFFTTCPIRMIGPVIITFRMRHQAEYPPGGIANTGDITYRAIGVERKAPVSKFTVRQGILHGHLVILPKLGQGGFICKKFSFTMAYRKFRQVDSPGKNTRRCRIHFKGDPLVSEISAVIKGKSHRSPLIVVLQARQQAQIGQRLEIRCKFPEQDCLFQQIQ